jgi:hypothetical protein
VGTTDIATSISGRWLAAWSATPSSGPSVVQATVRDLGGGWRPPVTISEAAADAGQPRVVVAPSGTGTVVWNRTSGGVQVVRAATIAASPTAGFGSPMILSPPDRDATRPRLAVDAVGDVVTFWGDSGASTFQARHATYDVAGPFLATFAAPHRAIAHRKVTFSASARDAWSPVATYTWSFSDGTTATGPTVTHAFAKRGTYAVKLTVVDGVGNGTTRVTSSKVLPRPRLTTFTLVDRRIRTTGKARLRIGLNLRAKVKIKLRSSQRHLVDGELHRVKILVKAERPAGLSTIVLDGSHLLPDTWVVTGTARRLGVDSSTRKQKLLVVD